MAPKSSGTHAVANFTNYSLKIIDIDSADITETRVIPPEQKTTLPVAKQHVRSIEWHPTKNIFTAITPYEVCMYQFESISAKP